MKAIRFQRSMEIRGTASPQLAAVATVLLCMTLVACHRNAFCPERSTARARRSGVLPLATNEGPKVRNLFLAGQENRDEIAPLKNHQTVELSALPSGALAIAAETSRNTHHVFFRLHTPGHPPADRSVDAEGKGSGAVASLPWSAGPGTVIVTAVPYAADGRRGQPQTLTLVFHGQVPQAPESPSQDSRRPVDVSRHAATRAALGMADLGDDQCRFEAGSARPSSCDANWNAGAARARLAPPEPGAREPQSTKGGAPQAECRAVLSAKDQMLIVCSHPFDRARKAYAFRSDTNQRVCDFFNVVSPSVASCASSEALVEAIRGQHVSVAFEDEGAAAQKPSHIVPIRLE